MSDETSAALLEGQKNWTTMHQETYLGSGGAEGHIMDLTAVGAYPFATHCMIRYLGRKSGRTMITPLCYGIYAGEVAIIGSKGGADNHPAWYLNLIARETIDFQIATQAYSGTWRHPEGEERAKVWNMMVDNFPFYANYQASTDRTIPVVLMKAAESIPVFRASDID